METGLGKTAKPQNKRAPNRDPNNPPGTTSLPLEPSNENDLHLLRTWRSTAAPRARAKRLEPPKKDVQVSSIMDNVRMIETASSSEESQASGDSSVYDDSDSESGSGSSSGSSTNSVSSDNSSGSSDSSDSDLVNNICAQITDLSLCIPEESKLYPPKKKIRFIFDKMNYKRVKSKIFPDMAYSTSETPGFTLSLTERVKIRKRASIDGNSLSEERNSPPEIPGVSPAFLDIPDPPIFVPEKSNYLTEGLCSQMYKYAAKPSPKIKSEVLPPPADPETSIIVRTNVVDLMLPYDIWCLGVIRARTKFEEWQVKEKQEKEAAAAELAAKKPEMKRKSVTSTSESTAKRSPDVVELLPSKKFKLESSVKEKPNSGVVVVKIETVENSNNNPVTTPLPLLSPPSKKNRRNVSRCGFPNLKKKPVVLQEASQKSVKHEFGSKFATFPHVDMSVHLGRGVQSRDTKEKTPNFCTLCMKTPLKKKQVLSSDSTEQFRCLRVGKRKKFDRDDPVCQRKSSSSKSSKTKSETLIPSNRSIHVLREKNPRFLDDFVDNLISPTMEKYEFVKINGKLQLEFSHNGNFV